MEFLKASGYFGRWRTIDVTKMVSLLPVESLVAISSNDSGGGKLRVRKSLNFRND